MIYNMTWVRDIEGPGDLILGTNTYLLGGGLGVFLMIILFSIAFASSMKKFDNVALSAFVGFTATSLVGGILWAATLMPFWLSVIPLPLMLISFLVLVIRGNG